MLLFGYQMRRVCVVLRQHLSDAKLLENGLVVFEASVKICPNLRPSVPFEPPTTLLHCPGIGPKQSQG